MLAAVAAKQGATVTIPEGGVRATVTQFKDLGGAQVFLLTLSVDSNAALGDRTVLLTNPDGAAGPPAPGLLTVMPAASLLSFAPAAAVAPRAVAPRDLNKLGAGHIKAKKGRY